MADKRRSRLPVPADPVPAATRQAVLVLGMHRSGTSSIAGTLARLGAALPRTLMPPQPDNPAGFYESAAIGGFNDDLLQAAGRSWSDWQPLDPPALTRAEDPVLVGRAAALLGSEFGDAPLVVAKDPRICRLLPLWLRAFQVAGYQTRILVPLRPPLEVARSLHARNAMPMQEGLLLWLRSMLDAERDSRGQKRAFVAWPSFLADWRRTVAELTSRLDLALPAPSEAAAAEIDAYLDTTMRHHIVAGTDPLPEPWIAEAEAALHTIGDPAHDTAAAAARDRLDAIEAEFTRATTFFAPLLAAAPAAPGTTPDPATRFVHDCLRKRLRPDDDPLVLGYVEDVIRGGRREHTVRAMETLRLLRRLDLLAPDRVIAETGRLGEIGEHLVASAIPCGQVAGDFRYALEAPDAGIDLLLSLEVLEHIKDQRPEGLHELAVFNGSGARRFAEECWRVVRPGGHLVLTTPNAASLFAIIEALEGRPPVLWRGHVREYAASEVVTLFTAAGFHCEHAESWYAYHFLDPDDIEPLASRYLDQTGSSRDCRGDDLCFVFHKPPG